MTINMMNDNKTDKPIPTCARVLVYRERNGKKEFLVIKGNTGRYALLGGAKDPEDRDFEDTIRREFLEEVGFFSIIFLWNQMQLKNYR